MQRWLAAVVCALVLCAPSAFARPFTTEQKLADFNQLVNVIDAGYGPRDYKANQRGIVLSDLADRYRAEVSATATNDEFYYTVARFIAEFKDGHFGISIPTNHRSSLPFGFDFVGGQIVLDWVDREKLSEADFPFERGDILVTFNGKPAEQALAEVKAYVGSGTDLSVTRIASWALTFRRGSRMPVPTGEVGETSFRKAVVGRVDTVKAGLLKWKEDGKPLTEFNTPSGEARLSSTNFVRNYNNLSVRETYADFIGEERLERSFACSGGTRIAIPKDWVNPADETDVKKTEVIMMKPFVAYYHYDPRFNGNVGYLRIPHYSPQTDGEEAYEERFAQYQYAVSVLEQNTVALIIDQDHNCGGRVSYLHDMLGLFYNETYQPTQFKLLATQAEITDFQGWVDFVPENTRERGWVESVLNLIKKTFTETTDFLTPKTSISGRPTMEPNEVNYTKPIIVLIDEIAGSGGDAFPGMMAGRPMTRLLGTRTSGLGGHVEAFPKLPNSQIGGRYTKSLFFRADGVAVENNGAVPSPGHEYAHSYNDFVDNYREYQAFYLQKLLELVQAQ